MKKYNYPPSTSVLENIYGQFFLKGNPLITFPNNFKKKGPSFRLDVPAFNVNYIVTEDPKLIEYIIQKNHKNYYKSEFQVDNLGKYLGYGLLTNNGEDWLRQRRLIQPGFNKGKIESLTNIMLEEVVSVMNNVKLGSEIDIYGTMNLLAFRIVAKTLFGASMSDEELMSLCQTITEVQIMIVNEATKPQFVWWYKLSGQITNTFKLSEKIKDAMKKVLTKRRAETGQFNDLLSMLMDARYEDNNEPMSDEKLIDEMLIIFVAGHETTANSLSWTVKYLSETPEAKQNLMDEIVEVGDAIYDVENLVKPSYTMCCINESMRLSPPAWAVDRVALNDDEFGGFSWKKGTVIIAYLYGLHRNPTLWEAPNDYKPERFLQLKKTPDNFFPFGAGPRMCIGNHFAMMEMALCIRYLYKNFDFKMTHKKVVSLPLVTLRPDAVRGILTKKSK